MLDGLVSSHPNSLPWSVIRLIGASKRQTPGFQVQFTHVKCLYSIGHSLFELCITLFRGGGGAVIKTNQTCIAFVSSNICELF
jgi:hypothetical protein